MSLRPDLSLSEPVINGYMLQYTSFVAGYYMRHPFHGLLSRSS